MLARAVPLAAAEAGLPAELARVACHSINLELSQRCSARAAPLARTLPWTMTDLASASASASVPRDAANCAPTRSEDSVRRRLSSCLCAAAALAHAPPLDEPALLHASAASSSSSCGSQAYVMRAPNSVVLPSFQSTACIQKLQYR